VHAADPVRDQRADIERREVCDTVGITMVLLINGPPAAGKSTLARRYVDHHDRAALVEFDALRMTQPNWEHDEGSRLVARDLAGAAVVEHLLGGRDVVMGQYFGRPGFIVALEGLALAHDATFVEVILATGAPMAIDRFRARRRALTEDGERHPERDIPDSEIDVFILDAVDRLDRLPTVRPASRILTVASGASEDEVYRDLLSILGE
jgi:predicted kinase